MEVLKYTLIADGSSDKVLMNIIKWTLDDLYPRLPNEGIFADFRHLPKPPQKADIKNQVNDAAEYYPFDVLFYHRDAESSDNDIIEKRVTEIKSQLDNSYSSKTICVIPIRMMEAWLLFDEMAIKKAAGNRNYTGNFNLPSINKLEAENDPKKILHNLLMDASGLKGRSLKKFNVHKRVHLVAENIADFSPLKQLKAFKRFEQDLKDVIDKLLARKL